MFNNTTQDELRTTCRNALESLELWLRSLIDTKLSENFGKDYFHFKDKNGNNLVKSAILKSCQDKVTKEPQRFSRLIDATFIEEIFDIICNPNLYNKYFNDALNEAFPVGREQAKHTFSKIITPRNYLSHANPISFRQAEQVICYSHDIIDSIKSYFIKMNKEKEFNVPTFITITDSLGNKFHSSELLVVGNKRVINSLNTRNNILFPSDELKIEVQVDESFSPTTYRIWWVFINGASIFEIKNQEGNLFQLSIKEKHISESFKIECYVASNKQWHKHQKYDDMFIITYKILPLPK
ncbi:hypothetical protein EFA69_01125 [Rufibacter immobilis]|uniref:Swt1-like HEPN domain-containing protein n=1 Tax=Rufibacter immobilis TaxID=1348778 RepID=A0A3M9N6P0_9BACT|nr:hypothetical protein [Rufibacter immobilis]RNI33055.1 hypothetical protein EFA69_01125 [Rufibacter immobilis]